MIFFSTFEGPDEVKPGRVDSHLADIDPGEGVDHSLDELGWLGLVDNSACHLSVIEQAGHRNRSNRGWDRMEH